jgi:hypothetical protein
MSWQPAKENATALTAAAPSLIEDSIFKDLSDSPIVLRQRPREFIATELAHSVSRNVYLTDRAATLATAEIVVSLGCRSLSGY